MLATSVAAHFLAPMPGIARAAMAIGGVLLVAPGESSDLYAAVFVASVLVQQIIAMRRNRAAGSEQAQA